MADDDLRRAAASPAQCPARAHEHRRRVAEGRGAALGHRRARRGARGADLYRPDLQLFLARRRGGPVHARHHPHGAAGRLRHPQGPRAAAAEGRMTTPRIEIDDITKYYGETLVLDGVSL